MAKNKHITKKEQHIYLSPFFYTQIKKLVSLGLVDTEWKNNRVHYSLTKLGRQLTSIFENIFAGEIET